MKKPRDDKKNSADRRKKYCKPSLRTAELFQRALVYCNKTSDMSCVPEQNIS